MSEEKKNDKHWNFHFLLDEFENESDRAIVILVVSIIDESLTTILKSKLIPIPSSKDSLFDNATAPISTFSSKIDLSFRIGLISPRMCKDIHLIRKIRNSLAHDIYGCNFDNGSVKSRITELASNCGIMDTYKYYLEISRPKVLPGSKGKFIFLSSAIVFHLNTLLENIDPIVTRVTELNELPYKDWTQQIAVMRKGSDEEKLETEEE